jgi:hypothetical protein
LAFAAALACPREARAIDFYEIQIYDTDTVPVGHLTLELHSNNATTATGERAKSQMDVYQVHETVVYHPFQSLEGAGRAPERSDGNSALRSKKCRKARKTGT